MKLLLSFLLFFLGYTTVSAQNTYTLRILDTQNHPMKNVVVTAENSVKNVVLKVTTNVEGKAVFSLVETGTYTFSYLEMKDVATTEIKEGYTGTFTRTTTYDPKGVFADKPKADRTGINFKTVTPQQLRTQPTAAKVIILVKQMDRTLVPNVDVTVVSIKDQTKYPGSSNASGQAVFYLPAGGDYEVDVAGLEAFHTFSIQNQKGLEMTEVVFYEKTKASETVKGDTIVQRAITQTNGTSTHILFTLNLNNYEGLPLPNEPVYLKAINGKRVYQGKTDEKGSCKLMLEKGTDYVVNLKHEQGVCLVEAPASQGFKSASATRRYRGSAAIEQLLAEQKAEMERIVADQAAAQKRWEEEQKLEALRPKPGDKQYPITYRETPIQKAEMPVNYLKKTAQGFDISFKASGPVGTPTVIENKLFTQEGLYSPNFYCLQASTGQYLWGVALGESGISPAVYHNGILLINTASCTLYAIDAATGKLLWSKWLAGYVYSTPTATENSVYVVYNHGGYPVVVSFDFHTGTFNWMQRVDNEAIACAVVEGNEVHVASQSGTYYVFDKETGAPIVKSTTLKAVSSPTVTADRIYLTAAIDGKEQLVSLNRKTLAIEKTYTTPLSAPKISGDRNVDHTDQMTFNGSHPIVYKNQVIIVTDGAKIVAFDAVTEQQIWQQAIKTEAGQVPIIADNKVIIASTTGEILSYDIKTGAPLVVMKTKANPEGQPVCGNGFIYIASAGVLSVIKSIKQYQWGQWNKDAGHNTYWR